MQLQIQVVVDAVMTTGNRGCECDAVGKDKVCENIVYTKYKINNNSAFHMKAYELKSIAEHH